MEKDAGPVNIEHEESEANFGVQIHDVELLGVEVIFEGTFSARGSFWVPFEPGLTALYGRNGAGKTTVLEGVRAALSGVKKLGMSTRLYLRLLATDDEMRQSNERSTSEFLERLQSFQEKIERVEVSESLNLEEEDSEVVARLPAWTSARHPPGGWFFRKLIGAVPKGAEFFDEERMLFGTGEVPGWSYPGPQLTREQIDAEEWAEFQFPSWTQIVRLLLLGNAAMDEAERERHLGDGGSNVNPVNEDVYTLCSELEASRILSFESNGDESQPRWILRLAAQVSGKTAGARVLENSINILDDDDNVKTDERLKEHIDHKLTTAGDLLERDNVVLASVLGSTLLRERARRELSDVGSGVLAPFAPVGREWSTVVIDRLPVLVKAVGPDGDCDALASRFVRASASPHWSGSLSVVHEDGVDLVDAALPNIDWANEMLEELAQKIRGLEVGISGMRLSLTGGLQRALSGGMLTFEVQDSLTGKWLFVHDLSAAQRSWVAFVLSLMGWIEADRTVLVADEVDRGLSERAVAPMMMLLESLYPITLFATHSPAALRSGIGKVLHVQRDRDGAIRLSSPSGVGSTREISDRLGISAAELLTFLQVVVMVEGEHDRIIFESLLRKSRRGSEFDTRVIPFRGLRQLTSVDARLLLEYTDSSIVLVVDNARQERLESALAEARELKGKLKRPKRIQAITSRLRESGSTFEESAVADVIEQAIERDIIDRVHVLGLPVRDILLVLPPQDFGLTDRWSTYEDAWNDDSRAGRTNEDFKSYLRSRHNARINLDSIQNSVDRLSSPPRALWQVFESIDLVRFRAGLNRFD
jgi:hypothetical protein